MYVVLWNSACAEDALKRALHTTVKTKLLIQHTNVCLDNESPLTMFLFLQCTRLRESSQFKARNLQSLDSRLEGCGKAHAQQY